MNGFDTMADDSYLKFMLASKKGGNSNNYHDDNCGGVGQVESNSQPTTTTSLPSQLSSILKNYQARYNNQVVVPIQVEVDNGLVLFTNMGVVGGEIKTLLAGLNTITGRVDDEGLGGSLGLKYRLSEGGGNQYERNTGRIQFPLYSDEAEKDRNELLLLSFKSTLNATLKKIENLIIALRKCVKEIDLYVDRGGRLLDKCVGSFVGFRGFGTSLEEIEDNSDNEGLIVDNDKEELYGSIQPSSVSPKTAGNNTQQQQTYNMTTVNTKILSDITTIQTGFIDNLYYRQELVDLVISKAGDLLVSSSNSNTNKANGKTNDEEDCDSNIDIRNSADDEGGSERVRREKDVREWEEVLRLIRKCQVDWGGGD